MGWLDKYNSNVPEKFSKGVTSSDATTVNKKLTPVNKNKVTQKELDDREVKERRDRIAVANAVQPYMLQSTKNFAVASSAIGDKLRISEKPNIFDDYINPASMFGHLASGLGQVPLNIQEGNYGQAAVSVLSPVAAGVAETLMSPIISKGAKSSKAAFDKNFTKVGKELAEIEKKGIAKGLSPQQIKNQQMQEVGITSLQREGYTPGVSEIVSEYITPYSYDNPVNRILDIPRRIIKGEKNSKNLSDVNFDFIYDFEDKGLVSKPRYDAWRMYSGLPQEYGTFRLAETSPVNHPSYSTQQLSNLEKFSLNDERKLLYDLPDPHETELLRLSYDTDSENLIEAIPHLKNKLEEIQNIKSKGIENVRSDFSTTNVMGGYNRRFFDDKVEYNDIWDLDLKGTKVDKYFGKPFMSHGQLDYSFKPAEDEINRLIRKAEMLKEYNANNINVKKPIKFETVNASNYNNLNLSDLKTTKKKNGGWLDKYNDGGPVQPNYNDYSVSAGPGFEGDGYSNVGRNYSPAWGGQFADGGELPNVTVKGKKQPIVVTDPKDPRLKAYKDSLSLYNESKNSESKIANIFAKAYKREGVNKSTVSKTIFEGKDIVEHPEKYTKREEGYIDSKLKKYNKKGIYGKSYPGEKYLGTPQYPATVQNLIQYNTEDIKDRNPYLSSSEVDINGLTQKERVQIANFANEALKKQYSIIKRTGYDPTYYADNGERPPNLIFKKPTQPVIYKEAPDRIPLRQDPPTLNVIQPGYPVDMDLPELQQIQQNSITRGKPLFPGGPQTDYYTPIDRMGNVQEGPYKTYAMGGPLKKFLQPTDSNLRIGWNPEAKGFSTEYSTTIGGPGEVYLVPGFKYGQLSKDPESEFINTGEHLGGPFKSVQSAEDFAELRHKFVEKGQKLPSPYKTKDYAMGGGIPGAVGFTYARTGSIPSNGPYAKKTKASAENGIGVPGEDEPLQLDPEEEFLFMGKPYEESDRSKEFPYLVPALPAEALYPIDININQKNLGLAEHTFTHQPGMNYDENLEGTASDTYMLKRTVNSFPTDEDVRLNIKMPTSPKDINFISNYKGAIGHVDEYPTSVPFEGEKHWNIDRFIIEPHFASNNDDLENYDIDKVQQRRNVLADMYKYYLLQNKGNEDLSWKQANEFMTKEIDPRISGPMYDKLRGNINYQSGLGITSIVDDDYVRNFNELKNAANVPESDRSEVEKEFLKNPLSDKQVKDLAMDWLINYKKMSAKEAEEYYNKLPKKQNGGKMKFYQEGLDFKPKTISKDGSQLVKLDQLTNFTNYNTKQPGGWLDKYEG